MEKKYIILPILYETELEAIYPDEVDSPILKPDLLKQIIQFYLSSNQNTYFNRRETITSYFSLVGQCFLYPEKFLDIFKPIFSSIWDLLKKRVFEKDHDYLNKTVINLMANFSAAFDFKVYKDNIFPVVTNLKPFIDIFFDSNKVQNYYPRTLEHIFVLSVNIIDNILTNSVNLQENREVTQFIVSLLSKSMDLSTPENQYWDKTKCIWENWTKLKTFYPVWHYKINVLAVNYVEKDESTDYKLLMLSKFIDIDRIDDLSSFIPLLTSTIDSFTQSIFTRIMEKAKDRPFIPAYPVNVIAGYFIGEGLKACKKCPRVDLVTKLMRLIYICEFNATNINFLAKSVTCLNGILDSILKSDQVDEIQKRRIIKGNCIFDYLTLATNSTSVTGFLASKLSDLKNSIKAELVKCLSLIVSLGSIQKLRISSDVMAAYRGRLQPHNKEADPFIIPILYYLFLHGDKHSEQHFKLFLSSFKTSDDNTLLSLYALLASLPYAKKDALIRKIFIPPLMKSLIERSDECSSVANFALLIMLVEIYACSGIPFATQLAPYKSNFTEYQCLLDLLLEARIKKQRFQYKDKEPPQVDRFVYDNTIYTVLYDNDTKVYTLNIRDAIGFSKIELNELISDTQIMPQLAELPTGKTEEVQQEDVLEIDGIDDPLFDIEDIEPIESENVSSLKTFGPSEIPPERSPVFEVLRMLGLIGDKNVRILPPSAEVDEYIKELDKTPALPTIYIPVYYVDQYSKTLEDRWDDNIISRILRCFSRGTKNKSSYWKTTNVAKFGFCKYDTPECQDSPIAFIINFTDMAIYKTAANNVKQKMVVSISPLGGGHYKFSIDKNLFTHPHPFIDEKARIVISDSLMAFHIIFFTFYSLLSNPEVFTRSAILRRQKLEQIPTGKGQLEYILKL